MTKTEELKEILFRNGNNPIGFDVETDEKGNLLCFSLAWGSDFKNQTKCFFVSEIVFPVKELDSSNLLIHAGKLTDIPAMNFYGQDIHPFVDTYAASKLWFWKEKQWDGGIHSAKALAKKILGLQDWGSAKELIARYGSMRATPRPIMEIYNRMDAWVEYRLWTEYFDKEFTGKLRELLFIESKLTASLARIQKVGILFDKSKIESIRAGIFSRLKIITEEIEKIAPSYPYGSPMDQVDYLFNRLKISSDGWEKTPKTKRPKLTQGEFERFSNRHPIFPLLIERSQLSTLATTFLSRYSDMADENSVIHPTFDSFGNVTGRFSSNMQNVPKMEVRSAFIPRPGFKMVSIDYSGAQLYAAAFIADDKETIKVLKDPTRDPHYETALLCHGYLRFGSEFTRLSLEEQKERLVITDSERKAIKGTTFGKLFNPGWPAAFLEYTGGDWTQAEKLQAVWYSKYPGIHRWHQWLLGEGADLDYTETYFGRKVPMYPVDRNFPSNYPEKKKWFEMRQRCARRATSASNHPVQGTEGDISKFGIVQVDDFFVKNKDSKGDVGHILLLIHDEVLVEIREDRFEEILLGALESFSNVPHLPIPMKSEAKVGKNWFELEKWRKE